MKVDFSKMEWLDIEQKAVNIQEEAHSFFYDSMIAEINDSLASILAACDNEGKQAIPKIKQYIHRINQSLSYIRDCQAGFSGSKHFNITASLKNLIHVIKHHYRNIKVIPLIADIRIPVIGMQSNFERFFLYSFGYLFSRAEKNSEVMIELRQKGQEVIITILKDSCKLTDEVIKRVYDLKEKSGIEGVLHLTAKGKGLEMIIKLPIQFKVISFKERSNLNE